MIDANSQFFAILTNVGMAKQANADALGIPWKITDMGVGDANDTDPIPNAAQTRLINEWRRRPLNQLRVDPVNPAVIIAEQIIPADEGGHWIREIGLYDADGDLVAVANCAPSFKPVLSQGSGRTQVVRMNFIVSSTGNITLKIDPAVVLATREYVDQRILEELYKLDSKQSVRVATTVNIALAGLQTIDGIALVAGDRVLVKSQTVAKDNGLYVAAAGAWARAPDADASSEVTSALIVSVEQGTTLADTRWQLVTDGAIVLGSTALVFQNITQGFAPINSPALINPTANTPAQFDSSPLLATTEYVNGVGLKFGPRTRHYNGALQLVLAALDVGSIISFNGNSSQTAKLPPTVALPIGATVKFVRSYVSPDVLAVISSDDGTAKIDSQAGGLVASFNLQGGEDVVAIWSGVAWILSGAYAFRANQFRATIAGGNGCQRLPSGWIIQCGVVSGASNQVAITFPLSFPNACLHVSGSIHDPAMPNVPYVFSVTSRTKNGFLANRTYNANFPGSSTMVGGYAVENASYIAVGY
ncbi:MULTISPECIES: phage tail protein [Pseudomonas]|uniref:phage tail protein n=1 Tax=Pseudomonas TaxID=286 RepID=UPI0005A945DA|nr:MULTISPECIES: phage tail protein [Pseudomonas]AZD93102.1 Phage tail fiber protein [Pseudomonas chlororaphis subsp. aureofaciens]KAB0532738.1 phage tail protein [Pseudomonas chlororaphis subsp. aureofaciens]TSD26074.1 phage tail protein [Pseudomonas sp. ATCC 13985]WDG45738.1 phage tail protein [Pseudomonas chlororaphis]WDG57903.1 phage tail protein [Pseudomonas chlororaphis]